MQQQRKTKRIMRLHTKQFGLQPGPVGDTKAGKQFNAFTEREAAQRAAGGKANSHAAAAPPAFTESTAGRG